VCFLSGFAGASAAVSRFLGADSHSEEEFEWYHPFAPVLKEALQKHGLASSQKVLVVGCGNSGAMRPQKNSTSPSGEAMPLPHSTESTLCRLLLVAFLQRLLLSGMSRQMCDEGYDNITNIDYSVSVIQKMKAKNAKTTMQCELPPRGFAWPCDSILRPTLTPAARNNTDAKSPKPFFFVLSPCRG